MAGIYYGRIVMLMITMMVVQAAAGKRVEGRIYEHSRRRNLLANGLADTPQMGFVF